MTYEHLYGEQFEAVLRYIRQEGAFGFTSEEKMEKLVLFFRVLFFRFQLLGNCFIAAPSAAAATLNFAPKKHHHLFKQLVNENCSYTVNKALVAECSYGF